MSIQREPLDRFFSIIPAGGIGSRLWPLSRASAPKFLHDLTGSGQTLLQDTWDRLTPIAGKDRIFWSDPTDPNIVRFSQTRRDGYQPEVSADLSLRIDQSGGDIGAMAILDDALVFSDDARIEQMFDAISRAGRKQQVIVFTCRARSFASLGGNALRIVQA